MTKVGVQPTPRPSQTTATFMFHDVLVNFATAATMANNGAQDRAQPTPLSITGSTPTVALWQAMAWTKKSSPNPSLPLLNHHHPLPPPSPLYLPFNYNDDPPEFPPYDKSQNGPVASSGHSGVRQGTANICYLGCGNCTNHLRLPSRHTTFLPVSLKMVPLMNSSI